MFCTGFGINSIYFQDYFLGGNNFEYHNIIFQVEHVKHNLSQYKTTIITSNINVFLNLRVCNAIPSVASNDSDIYFGI